MKALGLDIGTNSVGSSWINLDTGEIDVGLSVFPAGVVETDEARGEPKNAKRRMARRTRITLARRSLRKRLLRLELIARGLLPADEETFRKLLEGSDPWALRREGLSRSLHPHEFGRVLLHLAQRRGALGIREPEDDEELKSDDGKVKKAIGETRAAMLAESERVGQKIETFGQLIANLRDERRHAIDTDDKRLPAKQIGPREWRDAVRNKGGDFQFHADRAMIRDEFGKLWTKQKLFGGPLASILSDDLLNKLDDEAGDSTWRHKGLLFGQRRQSWDMGTLGRCVLEPTERCVPIADMYASFYRVIETVNNIKIIDSGKAARPLEPEERKAIIDCLRGPLGIYESGKNKGKPKKTVSVTELRNLRVFGWGRATKTTQHRFNIESDPDREINTDWFHRSIVHGAIGESRWNNMDGRTRASVNRAILNYDPDRDDHEKHCAPGAVKWWRCSDVEADLLIRAWKSPLH
ncbi:MAG: hypothetical protein IPK83_20185 [Planctomycetes bacterium]|nr:hypothetical protein [Planctomycetota bacterium]